MTTKRYPLLLIAVLVIAVVALLVSLQAPKPSASSGQSLSAPATSLPISGATATSTYSAPTATATPSPVVGLLRDGSAAEPDPALTPGAIDPAVTQANIATTICVSGYTSTVRPPTTYTTPLKRQQIVAYGYTDTNLADYEEDHLISLEIGGAPRDPDNLWPEPYAATASDGTPAGARVKDRFENWLHHQVCAAQLPLTAAQQQIAGDWVANWEAAGQP